MSEPFLDNEFSDYNASRIADLQAENDKLRALLAQGKGDCVYCGLPAAEISKCPSGFPGCARMDDIVATQETAKDVRILELTRIINSKAVVDCFVDSKIEMMLEINDLKGIIAGLQDVAAGLVRPLEDIDKDLEKQ